MVAVGLWAAQLGGRALWALPAAFVGAMAAGAATAWQGLELPLVESAIAVSLVLVGGAVWLARRVGLAAAVLVTAAAGFMHGQAHGAELPEAASPLAYALGFLAATAALHAVGVFGGRAMLTAGRRAGLALRGVGALVALGGVALLIA
jgi:urease accessory protein